jgi:hypothetical protein
MLVLATVLLVVGIFAVWANRLLFNPTNWANTSTRLLNDPRIRNTTANYLVDQIYANVNVPGLIQEGLPTRLQPLAAPAAGALRNAAVQGVDLALQRPRVQSLWANANHAADQTFINVVNGGHGAVGTRNGEVTLNLGLILDNVATRLGLPSDLSSKLPPNVAQLTIFKSKQLKVIQNGGKAIKGLAIGLSVLVVLLYVLAIALARGRRRRALLMVGVSGAVAGVVVLLGRSILSSQVAGALTNDASLRPTITAAVGITTEMLTEIAGACIFVGIAFILAASFAGEARWARSAREAIAPFLRDRPVETYAIALAAMVLLFLWDPIPATGKPLGMLILLALAMLGTYMLRRQTMAEFPEAQKGATSERLRARVDAARGRREEAKPPIAGGAPATVSEQLQQLADLQANGALTPSEYEAAKQKLLHT